MKDVRIYYRTKIKDKEKAALSGMVAALHSAINPRFAIEIYIYSALDGEHNFTAKPAEGVRAYHIRKNGREALFRNIGRFYQQLNKRKHDNYKR